MFDVVRMGDYEIDFISQDESGTKTLATINIFKNPDYCTGNNDLLCNVKLLYPHRQMLGYKKYTSVGNVINFVKEELIKSIKEQIEYDTNILKYIREEEIKL